MGIETALYLTFVMIADTRNSGEYVVIEWPPKQKSSVRVADKFGFQNRGTIYGLILYRL